MPTYRIFFSGFWPGFLEKTDANHIGFFEKLLPHTKLEDYEISMDPFSANVLIESYGARLCTFPHWRYKIFYSGESIPISYTDYDIVFCNENMKLNRIDLPLFAMYIHNHNFLRQLSMRPVITKPPSKFCCFIVSNPDARVRNNIFDRLNTYKRIDSYGRHRNNMQYQFLPPYWSQEYLDLISQYKFMLCFENNKTGTYMTEKIVNAYLANIVPLYWSTHHAKNIFDMKSMIFLENEDDPRSIDVFLQRIIDMDQNDALYLECVNRPMFVQPNPVENQYSLDSIAKYMDKQI
jgi:hypothetical protein